MPQPAGSDCEPDHTDRFFLGRPQFFLRTPQALDSRDESGTGDTTVPPTLGKGLAPPAPPMLSLAKS